MPVIAILQYLESRYSPYILQKMTVENPPKISYNSHQKEKNVIFSVGFLRHLGEEWEWRNETVEQYFNEASVFYRSGFILDGKLRNGWLRSGIPSVQRIV